MSSTSNRLFRGHTSIFASLSLALVAGCAAPALPPGPAIDARQIGLLQEESTRLTQPTRVLFSWRISEEGARFDGQGVARMEPPYRSRLDLFLDNGELVVMAALVDDDLRLPVTAPEGIIPPAPLLWAALGVLRPGRLATLLGGESVDSTSVRLRYRIPQGGEVHYLFRDGILERGELLRGGRVEETLELEQSGVASELPGVATYRNLPAFRELQVRVETIDHVESYPPDIWSFGR